MFGDSTPSKDELVKVVELKNRVIVCDYTEAGMWVCGGTLTYFIKYRPDELISYRTERLGEFLEKVDPESRVQGPGVDNIHLFLVKNKIEKVEDLKKVIKND